ncbi:MAG: DUF3179 domain-containing protein [Gammaproteobacteria bacterium]|nr:DUF3179 domain-containing protein [Gammaproteobacteria bacterium]
MSAPFYSRRLFPVCFLLLAGLVLAQNSRATDILADTFGFDDSTRKSVALDQLRQGCSARDCIPSIDKPRFVSASAASHLTDNDIVLALSWQGEYRAYPSRILDQHEIVNDVVGGTPIAVTYCPLCGSAVGVLRKINGQVTEFGVSGLLYNSALVFYDRTTETLWDQIAAEGIVGPLTGEKLELVPITVTRWGRWKAAHPETLVLSADQGAGRDYTQDYYAKYRQDERLMFPVSRTNDVIRPKEVVFGFDLGQETIAFTEALLQRSSKVSHTLNGRELTVIVAEDGAVTLVDGASAERFAPTRVFWFAWFTFHPQTELVR